MDREAVAFVLDSSTSDIALKERLRLGKDIDAINIAFDELDKLQSESMPSYDEWVALFYILWYQPKQINLAYSISKNLIGRRHASRTGSSSASNLHVIDVGCGALAMQFGVILAVAEALENGHKISSVHFDSIDQSTAMLKIGQSLWDDFIVRVSEHPELGSLSHALEIVDLSTWKGLDPSIEIAPGEEFWLTALHAVYASNVTFLERILRYFKNRFNPHVGLITSHYFKRDLVNRASPFQEDNRYVMINPNLVPQFSGQLAQVTGHRQGHMYSGLWGKARNYLDQPASWQWTQPSTFAYFKR